MQTPDLIRALASDVGSRGRPPRQALVIALIPGVAVAFSLFFATLGPRPHLIALLGEPRVLFKLALPWLLAGLSAFLVQRISQPGAETRGAFAPLMLVPVLLAGAVLAEMASIPAALWGQRLLGHNAIACLVSIPFLGLAPLVAILFALREAAPERPALAGASAGLLAGAIGAALYAAHCPDDSPFFVATWYALAVAIASSAGAYAGSKLLRW